MIEQVIVYAIALCVLVVPIMALKALYDDKKTS